MEKGKYTEVVKKKHHMSSSAPHHRRDDGMWSLGGTGTRASWVAFAAGRDPAAVSTAGLQAALWCFLVYVHLLVKLISTEGNTGLPGEHCLLQGRHPLLGFSWTKTNVCLVFFFFFSYSLFIQSSYYTTVSSLSLCSFYASLIPWTVTTLSSFFYNT